MKEDIVVRELDFKNLTEVELCANRHNEVPSLWNAKAKNTKESDEWLMEKMIKNSEDKEKLYLVAISENKVVGQIWGRVGESHGKMVGGISSIWVDQTHRGTIAAKKMNIKIESWMKEKGAILIEAQIHIKNPRMLKLAEYLGYEKAFYNVEKKL